MAINPSVSMEVSSFLKEYGETAETAHICPSFLAADDSSPLITDESTILEECFLMETEIKRLVHWLRILLKKDIETDAKTLASVVRNSSGQRTNTRSS